MRIWYFTEFDRSLAVAERFDALCAFNVWRYVSSLRQRIRANRFRSRQYGLEEGQVLFLRHNCCALRRVCSDSSGMIDVKMSHHDVLDRFVRNLRLDSFDDSYRAFFKQRCFDEDNVVFHFDSKAVMRASLDLVHAFRHLDKIHLLLAAEVLISDTHYDPAKRPL